MIGLTFSLSFMLVFMLAVMVMDALIELRHIRDWVNDHFSQDNSIVADHEYPDC
jgi:hypothetical protein